ncbi:MAG TPA: ribosome silencing factor [Syntrophaceticus sp.]|nr:ribosome silencing factor [Syntrophaceticus sp.]
MAIKAAQAAAEKKAHNVVVLDLRGIFPVADYFVICSGRSTTHLGAIAQEIQEELGKAGEGFFRKQGTPQSGWILLDYGSVVVHIFSEEARRFYDLEHLWGDASIIMQNS